MVKITNPVKQKQTVAIETVAQQGLTPGSRCGKIHPDWESFFEADAEVTQDLIADREQPRVSNTQAIAACYSVP